jgi:hypothetical protein
METDRHTETDQRSGVLDDLSHTVKDRKPLSGRPRPMTSLIPILKTVQGPRHCLPEKIAFSR